MRKIETDNYDVDFIEEVEVTELPPAAAAPPSVAYVQFERVGPVLFEVCPLYAMAYDVAS